jgi:hypothetical protein
VRGSNAVVGLTGDPLGAIWVQNNSNGTTNLTIDVAGYYQ